MVEVQSLPEVEVRDIIADGGLLFLFLLLLIGLIIFI
ncbi:MAG: hypothetical protein PWP70_1203 [Moorella sp. (in: firmicutes)]|nr:hypothetical protein [Moorella sp. (in: firmicutes)]